MLVRLAYGREGLEVTLPTEKCDVIRPRHPPASTAPLGMVVSALRNPVNAPSLRDLVRPGQQVVVSVCDGTRAQPRKLMLEAIFETLDGVIRLEDLTVLVATGTHRGNTPNELEAMLGPAVMASCRVVNHDARDKASLRFLGTVGGVPVWVNRIWADAEVRITTGFVEPHFFAGFSGGPKMVTPGLAGLETVMHLHSSARIASREATWGICVGNPVHDAIRAAAALAPPALACDVLLDNRQRITRAFAGELFAMHQAARRTARQVAMRSVPAAYDVVITTNAGFPLDQNLYQAVKGMAAAERVVRDGGTIIIAAECADGLPDHGSYGEVLGRASSVPELAAQLSNPSHAVPDQWQAQVQSRIQSRARVRVHCDGVDDRQLAAAHLEPAHDIASAVDEALSSAGPNARVCVLPEGPETIPYVSA